MNNEETRILNQNQTEETIAKTSDVKSSTGEKVVYAAGGFAAGVASGVAGSAMASTPNKEDAVVANEVVAEEPVQEETPVQEQTVTAPEQEQPVATTEAPQPTPNPEEVLLATDEGIRVAQVNDDASFAEAFADARAQVGPGGTFEWRGHVYSTYYEEEWNNMSAAERAEFQSKIDSQAMVGEDSENNPDLDIVAEDVVAEEPIIAADAEMVDEQPQQGGIKVLGVEAVVDSQGNSMTVAAIEIDNDQALLVDVDNNGIMDVIMVDENHDGQISENEIYDASEAQISTADLQNHMAASQDPGMMLACNDGMPDYVNDADVSSMA